MVNQYTQENIKWEHRQRLTLLEATVFWNGEVSTGVLMNAFGISRVQASKDFSVYQIMYPNNIRYDKSLKRYVLAATFQPGFMNGSVQEFVLIMKSRERALPGALVSLVGNSPKVDFLEPAFRAVELDVLRILSQAVLVSKQVEVSYQAVIGEEPTVLKLCPHALFHDGQRWFIRAFSHTHGGFDDFALVRMASCKLAGLSDIDPAEDKAWQHLVNVRIAPHPGLDAGQKAEVEFDYGMEFGGMDCQVRAALLPYFLRVMRIGRDAYQRDAMAQQIVVANEGEIREYWRF